MYFAYGNPRYVFRYLYLRTENKVFSTSDLEERGWAHWERISSRGEISEVENRTWGTDRARTQNGRPAEREEPVKRDPSARWIRFAAGCYLTARFVGLLWIRDTSRDFPRFPGPPRIMPFPSNQCFSAGSVSGGCAENNLATSRVITPLSISSFLGRAPRIA